MRLLRTLALTGLLGFALLEPLAAQSSMFGVRGLGFPGRPMTPREEGEKQAVAPLP